MKFSDGLKLGMGLSLGYAIMSVAGACILSCLVKKKPASKSTESK